jgi:hypothetical protein
MSKKELLIEVDDRANIKKEIRPCDDCDNEDCDCEETYPECKLNKLGK